MLQSLSIHNVVLIDKLDIDFNSGLSVMTGETGAGKSILLDSLGLILGARAETGLIRSGAEKLSVSAEFDLPGKGSPLAALLAENDLDVEDSLQIKRSLDRSGKGKIFVNDQPVSARLLKEIGANLVEVHGQFDNQGLLNPANHRDILDAFGNYPDVLNAVRQAWEDYKKIRKEREETESAMAEAQSDEDNLRHWLKELEQADIQDGEAEVLAQKRQELMNAEKIIENLSCAYKSLTQGSDVSGALRKAQSAIDKANSHVDGRYDEIMNMLEQALIDCNEALSQIEEASQNLNADDNQLDNIESRLFLLKDLARKHRCNVDELCQMREEFKTRLDKIEYGGENLENLRREEQQKRLAYINAANRLSTVRREAAKKLDALIMQELPPLKMEKARFETFVEPGGENSWGASGSDSVAFTVATNPNSPQGPLNKIASGGELSRFMLALKVNLAATGNVSTMVFDEIDAGIGGATAQAVGERLARLAQQVQILVVTHSPQVASRGKHHFKVEKRTVENITTTSVRELETAEVSEEIARMLAGETITDAARAAAKELLKK